MDVAERVEELLDEAFEWIDDDSVAVSRVLRRCSRIARLRNDAANLVWIHRELNDMQEKGSHDAVLRDILRANPELPMDYLKSLRERSFEEWLERRTTQHVERPGQLESKEVVFAASVSDLEDRLTHLEEEVRVWTKETWDPSPNVLPGAQDLKIYCEIELTQTKGLLARIRERAHRFLSETEREIANGNDARDVPGRSFDLVREALRDTAPELEQKLASAIAALRKGDQESLSHAMTSCRRAMNRLADHLFPAKEKPVVCSDGKEHALGENKWRNRLIEWVSVRQRSTRYKGAVIAEIKSFANKLEALADLASKGVHAEVETHEAKHCVVHTVLLVDELMQMRDLDSSV